MRPLTLLFSLAGLAFAGFASDQDARDIVRRSIDLEKGDAAIARNYTFLEREVHREIDSNSKVRRPKATPMTLLRVALPTPRGAQ
jgi:hypothetical protein